MLERWETTSTKRKADAERQRRYRERVTGKTPAVTRDNEGLSRVTEADVTRESDTEEKEKDITPLPPTGGEVDRAFDLWNETAAKLGLPLARTLNDARRRQLRKRLAESGLDGWTEALGRVARSKFLRGLSAPRKPGERPFQATLDFLLQASSFAKVLDGNYGDDAAPPRPTSPPAAPFDEGARWRRALDGFKRDLWWPEDELGPRPGRTGCLVPSDLLLEYGFTAEVIPLRQATA
ncbi:hypothetical protein LRS10_09525 [Phenylobacterium sp. J426]|uniref:hypothetical protein n=1 Tax=Phenylobacterium sp. J426 TaxID=2898439 RepID=UPI002150CD16|nr:hypothetical protein [Phenylobacterium sp. J426]MCR5874382.1 hypothetical protein [Phenylobacterium sp. J426]